MDEPTTSGSGMLFMHLNPACCTPQVKLQLKLDKSQLLSISESMLEQMQSGLNRQSDSSLLMLPSHLSSVPSGQEKGDFLALDLGGTNFRVLKVCSMLPTFVHVAVLEHVASW
jgi:hexokinase